MNKMKIFVQIWSPIKELSLNSFLKKHLPIILGQLYVTGVRKWEIKMKIMKENVFTVLFYYLLLWDSWKRFDIDVNKV